MMITLTKVLYTSRNISLISSMLATKYRIANWKWAGIGIPKKEDIEDTFHHLIERAKEEGQMISTGGLYAEYKYGKLNIGVEQSKDSSSYPVLVTVEEWDSWLRKTTKTIRIKLEDGTVYGLNQNQEE